MERAVECPICTNDFEVPKQLPCQHTFCLKCMIRCCEDEDEGAKMPCPICRREFTIPKGGVNQLPDEKFIMRLVLEKKQEQNQISLPKCDLCQKNDQSQVAVVYCFECERNMCQNCHDIHSNLKRIKAHKTVDIKDKPSDMELQKFQTSYCLKHDSEQAVLFCCFCKVAHCSICHVAEHKEHECKLVCDIAKEMKKNMESDTGILENYLSQTVGRIQMLLSSKQNFMRQLSDADDSIRKRCEEFRCAVNEYEKEMLQELCDIKKGRLKEIAELNEKLEFYKTMLNSYMTYSQALIDQGTDHEIVRAAFNLHKRAEGLMRSHEAYKQDRLNLKLLRFVKSSSSCADLDIIKNQLGSLLYKVADSITHFISNDYTSSKEISSEITMPVKGLDVVNNELFVVRGGQSQVNVYDSRRLTSSRDINIPGMELPEGLAGCAHNKALYISDQKLKCIHRVDLTKNSITRLKMKKDYEPWGLSVTAERNLLVTVGIRGTDGESVVVEYTSKGQQVREIRLDRSIECAWQTVQLSSYQFIVSHGFRETVSLDRVNAAPQIIKSYGREQGEGEGQLNWLRALKIDNNCKHVFVADMDNIVYHGWKDYSLHRVCQINAEGQIIKSYGRERGGGQGQLNVPFSLTIDNNSKRVFLADMDNHRILLLDSDLTYLGKVHTSRDFKYPYRLYFDSSTDRLFVGELSGRVIVISPKV